MKQRFSEIIGSIDSDIRWEWVPLSRPLSIDFYKQWIQDNYHGNMTYLKNHIPEKENPGKLLPMAKSAFVFTHDYYPPTESRQTDFSLKSCRIATYALGEDYHHWFKDKLQNICEKLQKAFPGENFATFVDSAPVLERELAQRAGLGWLGKNTCLIDREKGSLFFLGEIYSTLDNQTEVEMTPNHCGSCQRCLDACPTGALISPQKMDATRCISYLTIENRDIPSIELRSQIGDWLFGCDICQTVCPWNEKVFGKKTMEELTTQKPANKELINELSFILSSSNKGLIKSFKGTPLARAAGNKLKRNAIIVSSNLQLRELLPHITRYQDHQYLGELARWGLKKIASRVN